MDASLDSDQRALYDKYKFSNYARSLTMTPAQLDKWRKEKIIFPEPLSRETSLQVEMATRGQSKNTLWNLLRLDRSTASRSSTGAAFRSSALAFGNAQEANVKISNEQLFVQLSELAEMRVGCAVVNTVLDCGMFISPLGLHSASPDVYFAMADDSWIPVEIKCPFNYRDTTVDQMRLEFGKANRKYRVKHTALLVNKTGEAQFEIVKTHEHYRQMQRQMYVMRNSPFCFYVVRFKYNLVALTVARDDVFCNKEMITESSAFVAFAMENAKREQFKRGDRRQESFAQNAANHSYNVGQVDALVRRGMYMSYGQLKCAHCDGFELDGRASFELATTRPHERCDGLALQEHKYDNINFLDYDKRYKSLIEKYHSGARELAVQGYYSSSDGIVKTFCCNSVKEHLDTCSYYLAVIKKSI